MTTKKPEASKTSETNPATPAKAAKANAARRAAAKADAEAKTDAEAAPTKPQPEASPTPKLPRTDPVPAAAANLARPQSAAAPVKSAPRPEPTNGWLVSELRSTLEEGKKDVSIVRRRLRVTYAVIVIFSLAMFALGMALVGFPGRAYYSGEIDELTFGTLAGSGGVVLALLLYFRPLDRLQALVADSTYVALVKDSFQYQVALRLIALDTDDAQSVENAATYVGEAAQASMELVYTQMQARRAAGFSASGGT